MIEVVTDATKTVTGTAANTPTIPAIAAPAGSTRRMTAGCRPTLRP